MLIGMILIMCFTVSMATVKADTSTKQVKGEVIPNTITRVRAFDFNLAKNGLVFYYVQNRTNEGNGVDDIKTTGDIDYYDPFLENDLNDWKVGDPCIIIVERESGSYETDDRTGYIAFTSTILNSDGLQNTPPIELQRIPIPRVADFGFNFINITWSPISDPNGLVAGYTVYRSTTNGSSNGDADWSLVGGDMANPLTDTYFNDTQVLGRVEYYYSIKICLKGYRFDDGGAIDNYENMHLGEGAGPFITIMSPPTVDFIEITDVPDGIRVDGGIVPAGFSEWYNCSVYNITHGFIGVEVVNWTAEGGTSSLLAPSPSKSNGIDVGDVPGHIYLNVSYGPFRDSVHFLITTHTVDFIKITDFPDGSPLVGETVSVGDLVSGYCSAYNISEGFIGTVSSDWTAEGGDSILLGPTPAVKNDIYFGTISGFVWFNISYQGNTDSIKYLVSSPTVDYIQIRDQSNGLGNIVSNEFYFVWQKDQFYAASYNDTAGYLGDVEAEWSSNDTTIGAIQELVSWANFTAQKIKSDAYCHVTANYFGIINTTGDLRILAPKIDYIVILDTSYGEGVWVSEKSYSEGETDTFWAAGYNYTADYIKDVKAMWESDNEAVGTVALGPNENTDFSAGWVGGSCRITATYGILTNETGDLSVINVNQLPTARAQYHNGTGLLPGESSFSLNLTLRVAGTKGNTITMELNEDGNTVGSVMVIRDSNEPDMGTISSELYMNSVYELSFYYDGANGGSNPFVVTFEFLGKFYSVYLLFNSQDGSVQQTSINLNDILQKVGIAFFDASSSFDFEGYLVDYQWDFGDGTTGFGRTLAHNYKENRIYTVTLRVTDDEGGTNETTFTVNVHSIDENDQAKAIQSQNAALSFLNDGRQFAVILQCPADLLITNQENYKIGLLDASTINNMEGAFIAMLFSDVEVYFIPSDELYYFDVQGFGSGVYDLSIIGVDDNIAKKYGIFEVACSTNTQDRYILDPNEQEISLTTEEDGKLYSLEFSTYVNEIEDRFYLTNMGLDKNATHIYRINTWENLSSGKPVTLMIDEDGDGSIDKTVDLQSGLTGDEVDALIVKSPVGESVFPWALVIMVGFIFAIGAGTLLTEIGKWVLLALFLPLYSKIKKEEMLNHPVRHKIHGYIIASPGAHFGLIKQDLDLGNGQLIYHLKRLMEATLIYSKEDGIKKRFYPVDFPKTKAKDYYLSVVQEKIFGVIQKKPGISQKKIASSTGVSRQVAGYHLSKLEEVGFVKKEVVGRERKYYASRDTGA